MEDGVYRRLLDLDYKLVLATALSPAMFGF